MELFVRLDNNKEIKLKELQGLDKDSEVIFVQLKDLPGQMYTEHYHKSVQKLHDKIEEKTGKEVIILGNIVEKIMTL